MVNSLWPDFTKATAKRGMREMLKDAAGDINVHTQGKLEFYIDTIALQGTVHEVRHNCYLRVPSADYNYLLFQVTTPVPGPWPAHIGTPEGEAFEDLQDEQQLRDALRTILQRERTEEIVLFLLGTVA